MTLKPIKVIYQLVVGEFDEAGELVAEHPQQAVTLYAPQFGDLEERIASTMAGAPQHVESAGMPSTDSAK